MKKITKAILMVTLAFFGLSNVVKAQTLFKDLIPGNVSSQPQAFITINGTMYFYTWASSPLLYQLWKSDGTAANTTLLKDTLINTNTNGVVTLHNVNGTLFFAINKNGSSTSATTTELWKSDGTTVGTVLITTLTHTSGGGSGGAPLNWTVVGSKLFFSMGKSTSGRELWVSDGTAVGTMQVKDLTTGSTGGAGDMPMAAYNGKVYFQGTTNGFNFELYESDGTTAGTILVKEINPSTFGSSDPKWWVIYNGELYFTANDGTSDGLWKTNGTTVGTVNVYQGSVGKKTVFKNNIYFESGINTWRSDGTTLGTAFFTDSANVFNGANSNYLFTQYMKSLPTPPWFRMMYKRIDGTTSTSVSYNLGSSASYVLINDKMYWTRLDSGSTSVAGLWETDGTEAGTIKLFASGNTIGPPYAFNDTIFYSDWLSGGGYELFYYVPIVTGTGISSIQNSESSVTVYPNPSSGIIQISISGMRTEDITLMITDVLGKEVYSEKITHAVNNATLDLSHLSIGIYFVNANKTVRKIIIQK